MKNQFAKSKAIIMRDIAPIGDLIVNHLDIKKIVMSLPGWQKIQQLLKNITGEYVERNSYTVA